MRPCGKFEGMPIAGPPRPGATWLMGIAPRDGARAVGRGGGAARVGGGRPEGRGQRVRAADREVEREATVADAQVVRQRGGEGVSLLEQQVLRGVDVRHLEADDEISQSPRRLESIAVDVAGGELVVGTNRVIDASDDLAIFEDVGEGADERPELD